MKRWEIMAFPSFPSLRSLFIFHISLFYLALATPGWGDFSRSDRGTSAAQFLKINTGPRAAAMAGAFTAVADDASASAWNPAGIALCGRREMSVSQVNFPSFYEYRLISAVEPLPWGSVGVSVHHLHYGGILKTDNTGARLGEFSPSDQAYALTWAMALRPSLIAGTNLKFLRQVIDDGNAAVGAVDFGALYRAGPVSLAAVAAHAGPRMSWKNEKAPLPLTFRLGAALSAQKNEAASDSVALDLEWARDDAPQARLGLERWITLDTASANPVSLAFRAGFAGGSWRRSEPQAALTAGVGIWYKSFGFDFAFGPAGFLGNAIQLGFRIRFGEIH